MSLVERPAPPASSPRPTFDGPALIRRADVTRHVWGDPAAGEVFDWIYASTERVHMLVFGLAAGRRVPPLGGLPHDLRGRRAAARARGRARDRRPRDRRGPARRRRARACSSAATPGTTRSRSGRSRCACSSCSRRRPRRARRARTRARSRTSRQSRYADDALLGALAARRAAASRGCACCAPADVLWRRDLGVLCGDPRQHRAPDGRDARDRAGRGRRARTSTAATRC